jgi:hypothetical protein
MENRAGVMDAGSAAAAASDAVSAKQQTAARMVRMVFIGLLSFNLRMFMCGLTGRAAIPPTQV